MRHAPVFVIPSLLTFALLGACTAPPSARTTDGRLRVVAAESPWGAVAQAVGGSDVEVTSLVATPNVDPHEYTPTASAAASVATASLVVENGLGYDTFMDNLLSSGSVRPRNVISAAEVLGVSGTGANPHLWYAIDRVPSVALAIERALVSVDPAHRSDYEQRLKTFDTSLAPTIAVLERIRHLRPGAPVAETERVAGYLLSEAGLKVVSPPQFEAAIESGVEPSARATSQMADVLSSRLAEALVLNSQTVSPVTDRAVASARLARVPVVPMSEVVLPVGRSFARWQAEQVDALAHALGVAP